MLPSWASWNGRVKQRYTIGVEEELMLLGGAPTHAPSPSSDEVLSRLSGALSACISPETHASVIEVVTGIHRVVTDASAELAALRAQLARELGEQGLHAACAGTYPLARRDDTRTSAAGRYGTVTASMRMLARREPTLALHVHVGIPDPEDAVRLLNGLREVVPVLVALSANSPFSGGRDSGFASARTVIFQAFPRTGTARRFAGYGDYVEAVDALIASGALPDPSFLWWDVRLQPALGTVEVRAMDAQSSVADTAPLVALVQSFAMLVLEGEPTNAGTAPEVLAENRFLAARDGLHAQLINPATRRLEPLRDLVDDLVERCRPCAAALGCSAELEQIGRLAAVNGADLQRAWAREGGLLGLIATLSRRFTAPEPDFWRPTAPPATPDACALVPAGEQQRGLDAVRLARPMRVTARHPGCSFNDELPGSATEGSSHPTQWFVGLPIAQAALRFAQRRHAGQYREIDHAPFVDHPIEVGWLLCRYGQSEEVIAAGLLHDVLEKTATSGAELERRFGPRIVRLVESVSDDASVTDYEFRKRELRRRVAQGGLGTLAVFAADKIAKVRELALLPAERFREPTVRAKLRHYRASLEMLHRTAGELDLVDLLDAELERVVARTVTRSRR